MPLPEIGQTAADFTLKAYDSDASVHLADVTAQAPALVAFFKLSCVTSNMTLPFLERLHRRYPRLQLLGVSQDNVEETTENATQAGLTFPVLLDSDWKVSAAYDLFTVPSVFLLERGGVVKRVNMGWNKEHYSALSDEIAQLLGDAPVPLFADTDKVPPFKPG